MDPVVQMVSSHILLDVVVHDRSLSRGLPFTCPPPEQYFNPTTYNFGRCIRDEIFNLENIIPLVMFMHVFIYPRGVFDFVILAQQMLPVCSILEWCT